MLSSATVPPSGANARFVWNKLLWAAPHVIDRQDGMTYKMIVENVVYAFQHCHIDNINKAIQQRDLVESQHWFRHPNSHSCQV